MEERYTAAKFQAICEGAARRNWKEQPQRESLTGVQWRT
jgi:hypothetical protein